MYVKHWNSYFLEKRMDLSGCPQLILCSIIISRLEIYLKNKIRLGAISVFELWSNKGASHLMIARKSLERRTRTLTFIHKITSAIFSVETWQTFALKSGLSV